MSDWFISAANAQDSAPATTATTAAPADAAGASHPPASLLNSAMNFAPLLLLAVFYFAIIRPQTKRAKETRDMISRLSKGDEVLTSGGMAGRVAQIGENYVTLEVAERVEIKVQKSAVTTVLPKGSLKNL